MNDAAGGKKATAAKLSLEVPDNPCLAADSSHGSETEGHKGGSIDLRRRSYTRTFATDGLMLAAPLPASEGPNEQHTNTHTHTCYAS